ncbi:MAG: MFS transporter [Phycisphaerales bacterium]|nr:MFS transporter [Phycisphaerales bacterium]
MGHEASKAIRWGLFTTTVLAVLIVVGSRNLAHFDAALVGYTFATLFAVFGITYRYVMWLQRPPTALYWRRGWQVFLDRRYLLGNLRVLVWRLLAVFASNNFIWRRGRKRWAAHWLIMWGCVLAALITFPLVFGWVHFDMPAGDFEHYVVYVLGFPTMTFPVEGVLAFLVFHGLVWAALLVIPGVMIAMHRRMRDHGAGAVQQFGEDFLPLILLFAISVTGLMLTASYTWMRGYAFDFLAILHAIAVILTLLWLPFGKFFHILQRPAQIGVAFYRDIGGRAGLAACARCGQEYATRMQIDDLIEVERRLGYRYELGDGQADHYQRVCPQCRRAMLAIAQGMLWSSARGPVVEPMFDIATMMSPQQER